MFNATNRLLSMFRDVLKHAKRADKATLALVQKTLPITVSGERFILPVNGVLIEDSSLKGLDREAELHLPFPVTLLEFPISKEGEYVVLVCYEVRDPRDEDWIYFHCFHVNEDMWFSGLKGFSLPVKNWGRDIDGQVEIILGVPRDGGPAFEELDPELQHSLREEGVDLSARILKFLNVLACSNVEATIVRPPTKAVRKGPIQKDEYRVLTLRGTSTSDAVEQRGSYEHSRSPREHVRRGHIRRLATGKTTWVNATVVNKGAPAKITKDYEVLPTV